MKYNLKDRVVIKTQVGASYDYNVGTVIAHTDDGFHVVEFPYSNCSKVKGSDLITEAEAKEVKAGLEAEKAKLEKEFTAVRKQIGEKLTQAVELIRESKKLASKHHRDLDGLDGTDDLFDVISDIGWISSSSNC